MGDYVAAAETEISATPAQVWTALTDPVQIKSYMFGTDVKTDWRKGSPITWSGEYQGKAYEDKGEIIEIEPEQRLVVTHFSPLTGQDDVPENYHTLTYELTNVGEATYLSLRQDHNASPEEVEHSTGMWEALLAGLKRTVEQG